MRRTMRSRVLAVGAATALIFTAVGWTLADNMQVDTDISQAGLQNTIDLGTVTGGSAQTTSAYETIVYQGANHLSPGDVVDFTQDTVASTAGVSASDVSVTVPADWGSSINQQAQTNASTISFTAPTTAGPYSYTVKFSPSNDGTTPACAFYTGSQASNKCLTDGSGGGSAFTITFTVAAVVGSTNTAPTVDAGGPYSGNEGSSIAINGASASDPDAGDYIASYSWTKSESGFDAGYSCTLTNETSISPSLRCTDNGTVTLTLTVTDSHGASSHDNATVTVNNADPVVGSASLAAGATTCSVNLSAAFTDAGVNDTHTASVAWGDTTSSAGAVTEAAQSGTGTVAASHSYATIGSYTATVTVTDDNGGSGNKGTNASPLVGYTTGGILQPINPGPPTSLFKLGSTIPVKIQVTNCNGSVSSSLLLYVVITQTSSNPPVVYDTEVSSTSAADTGNQMRFSSPQYIFNLYTKSPYLPDPTATYRIDIRYGTSTGPSIANALFGLKS